MQRTQFVAASVLAAALLVPSVSSAQTVDIQVQIKSLMEQIQALQMQLKTLIASSTALKINDIVRVKMDGDMMPPGQFGKEMCMTFARDLQVGSQGEDVRKLQELLLKDPESGFRAKATGFFGPLTSSALARFQMKMGIATSTDGRVGPITRGFFERRCGNGFEHMVRGASVHGEIMSVSGSTMTVGEPGDDDARIVSWNASTTIRVLATATSSPTAGSASDLVAGKQVIVEGIKNADGTLTAKLIVVGVPRKPERKNVEFKLKMRDGRIEFEN